MSARNKEFSLTERTTMEVPIQGMDCAECTRHVKSAIAGIHGVEQVEVFLASEKALIQVDASQAAQPEFQAAVRSAVQAAGYSVRETGEQAAAPTGRSFASFTRPVLVLFGVVFGAVLFIVVVGEWLGLFEAVTARVPLWVGLVLVAVAGFPVFRNVVRAALRGQIISHTLMTAGAAAALLVGEWATALVVVFFMRVGEYAERFTAERARRAVKDLSALAPQLARVERGGAEVETPVDEVQTGEVVVVRPGEMIPVDGEVLSGTASVDQAAITGESLLVEVEPGAKVYAASYAHQGSLRIAVRGVGADTTFGRVIRLVEEAEAHRADVQRIADRFSAYYLPVVALIAALTFLLRRDPLATAAVLVVACSCSFALATPIAMMASIGAAARHGLMIKGGKYLELLARADVLLIDKTGTLTLGEPQVVEVRAAPEMEHDPLLARFPLASTANGLNQTQQALLYYAASAERYSEHPLAGAVRRAALEHNLPLAEPQDFRALPGQGVQAQVEGVTVWVGSQRMAAVLQGSPQALVDRVGASGQTLIFIALNGSLAGVLAAADTLRPETPEAIQAVRDLGIQHIELLTGDNQRTAAALAERLGIPFQAELLPEDKIRLVKEYQARGHTVVMVGDGVNDAPALAQADVGMAMGAAGSDIAIEAAHVALMRSDWRLVPEAFLLSRRTLRVVKTNIFFTALYNLVGLSLAALGFLPPIFAAAAQSLPDLGILANSSRLLRYRRANPPRD
jgi:P-type Cu+ transporter